MLSSKGDAFGAGAVLKSEAYEASVFARSDCKLIGIPRASLLVSATTVVLCEQRHFASDKRQLGADANHDLTRM